jgi:hypothetical protein
MMCAGIFPLEKREYQLEVEDLHEGERQPNWLRLAGEPTEELDDLFLCPDALYFAHGKRIYQLRPLLNHARGDGSHVRDLEYVTRSMLTPAVAIL